MAEIQPPTEPVPKSWFWKIIEHPRTNLIVALVLTGIGIFSPKVVAYLLWVVAAVLVLRSAYEWEPIGARLPFELQWPVIRRGPAKLIAVALPTAERGWLDFELDVVRAMQRVTPILGKMTSETNRNTKEVIGNTRLWDAVKDADIYKRHKAATKTARGLNGFARRLERLEEDYRATTRTIAENYLELIRAAPNPLDALVPSLEAMAQSTRGAKAGQVEQRESVANNRKLGMSQDFNQACDHLMAVLDKVVDDFDKFAGFCDEALRLLAEKSASRPKP